MRQQFGRWQQLVQQAFTASTGYRIEPTLMSLANIETEVEFQLKNNLAMNDGWVLDVTTNSAVVRARGAAALEPLTSTLAGTLADEDVHPFFQQYGAMYEGSRTAVVLSGRVPLLYWRRDLFAALNLTGPPATWEELLGAARRLEGVDLNGDGAPDSLICWQLAGCSEEGGIVLSAMLAAMTQYQGSSTGWLLRPDTMASLAAGPPLRRALSLLRSLSQLSAARGGSSSCPTLHAGFFEGRCAVTMGKAQHFKVAQLMSRTLFKKDLRGLVGAAPLPGSAVVWNRDANAWLDCDAAPSACPHAVVATLMSSNDTVATAGTAGSRRRLAAEAPLDGGSAQSPAGGEQTTSPLPPSSSGDGRSGGAAVGLVGTAAGIDGGSGAGNSSAAVANSTLGGAHATTTPSAGGAVPTFRVNRAPFLGTTALLGSVSSRVAPEYQAGAVAYFAQASSPYWSWLLLLSPYSDVGPFRKQHLNQSNMSVWLNASFERADLQSFLSAWSHALESPNAALPLRLPGADKVETCLEDAAQAAGGDAAIESIEAELAAGLAKALSPAESGAAPAELQRGYWRSIGYIPDLPGGSGGSSSWDGTRLGVVVAAAASAGLALLVAGLVGVAALRRRRSLFGRALAPGASPATSLLVTDIVDSTRLWETVPATVMSRAVQLHHDTLRSLLAAHNGYESATEGDSFILSFYTAADAVAFALRAQAALMHQPWPPELGELELCRPKYAVERSAAERGRSAPRMTRRPTGLPPQSPGSVEPLGPTSQPQPHPAASTNGSPRTGAGSGVLGDFSQRGGARSILVGLREALASGVSGVGAVGGLGAGTMSASQATWMLPAAALMAPGEEPRSAPFAAMSLPLRRSASALIQQAHQARQHSGQADALPAATQAPTAHSGVGGGGGSAGGRHLGATAAEARPAGHTGPTQPRRRSAPRATSSMPQLTAGIPPWLQRPQRPSSSGLSPGSQSQSRLLGRRALPLSRSQSRARRSADGDGSTRLCADGVAAGRPGDMADIQTEPVNVQDLEPGDDAEASASAPLPGMDHVSAAHAAAGRAGSSVGEAGGGVEANGTLGSGGDGAHEAEGGGVRGGRAAVGIVGISHREIFLMETATSGATASGEMPSPRPQLHAWPGEPLSRPLQFSGPAATSTLPSASPAGALLLPGGGGGGSGAHDASGSRAASRSAAASHARPAPPSIVIPTTWMGSGAATAGGAAATPGADLTGTLDAALTAELGRESEAGDGETITSELAAGQLSTAGMGLGLGMPHWALGPGFLSTVQPSTVSVSGAAMGTAASSSGLVGAAQRRLALPQRSALASALAAGVWGIGGSHE
ncbi:hypothetical protein GPECTOR_2g1583 [Gonium pectorale]|uniref:Guanylate cyclase domain-containing protein n=1 Tax=Gonium pectorale TaxID=33097 RepID=A0A150H1Q8_GONPE|nr:hypothetical protein GPECTOR_2g1583 [Gonium pectorale]|eukprot:KXZ56031.1 hypothetical protein GPECTOR_2g1583 [Gonium pectorale]